MDRKWFIDGKEVSFSQVINEAKKYGYGSKDEWMLRTSDAARILEQNGVEVRCEETP